MRPLGVRFTAKDFMILEPPYNFNVLIITFCVRSEGSILDQFFLQKSPAIFLVLVKYIANFVKLYA